LPTCAHPRFVRKVFPLGTCQPAPGRSPRFFNSPGHRLSHSKTAPDPPLPTPRLFWAHVARTPSRCVHQHIGNFPAHQLSCCSGHLLPRIALNGHTQRETIQSSSHCDGSGVPPPEGPLKARVTFAFTAPTSRQRARPLVAEQQPTRRHKAGLLRGALQDASKAAIPGALATDRPDGRARARR